MTTSSYYTSLSGLKAAQTDLSVVSNNIANVGSIGFKKSRATFGDVVAASTVQASSTTPGLGTRLQTTQQLFTQGSFQTSDRTLDLAVSGQGFFVTHSTVAGGVTAFTRAGALTTDDNNNVIDSTGAFLQVLPVDAEGNVTSTGLAATTNLQIPATTGTGDAVSKLETVSVDPKGLVVATYANGTAAKLGRIAIANFPDPEGLRQLGNSSWTPTGRSGDPSVGAAGDDGFGAIQAGALEQSNVDLTEELVQLIQAQRNFQANAKAIDTSTQILDAAVNLRT